MRNNSGKSEKANKRFLRQKDKDQLDDRINGIPLFKRVTTLMRVLTRIEVLETSIGNNTTLTSERRARLMVIFEEVKAFIQDKLEILPGLEPEILYPLLSHH